MELSLRTPKVGEAKLLTDICLRSKAVWGYDQDFIQACRSELTITEQALLASNTNYAIATLNAEIVGIVQISMQPPYFEIVKLFVEPKWLRRGIGRTLFEWAKQKALESGAEALVVESDPGAANFYRHLGAKDDGVAASGSIPGCVIPRLKIRL